jgi:SOS response associated peptidase (SRAP)
MVPFWAKDAKRASANARAETVHEKPTFRTAFAKRRLLVPVDGFYEWFAVVDPSVGHRSPHARGHRGPAAPDRVADLIEPATVESADVGAGRRPAWRGPRRERSRIPSLGRPLCLCGEGSGRVLAGW